MWALLTATLVPSLVGAQTDGVRRTFSLDSRYVVQTYSIDAVAGFGIDVLNLATLPVQLIDPSTRLRNAGQGVLLLVGSVILGESLGVAYHEYGHGTRSAAAGMKPRYGFGIISSQADFDERVFDSASQNTSTSTQRSLWQRRVNGKTELSGNLGDLVALVLKCVHRLEDEWPRVRVDNSPVKWRGDRSHALEPAVNQ